MIVTVNHPLVRQCCKEEFDVYVGRRHKRFPLEDGYWGNPFILFQEQDREKVLEQYTNWLYGQDRILQRLPELKGKRLGCWCGPKKLCRASILAELANYKP